MSVIFDFRGKTVLVTGGSKGIGFGLVVELARSNAKVISVSRTIQPILDLKSENPKLSIACYSCDLSDWSATEKLITGFGHIDYLVNNAAVSNLINFGDIEEKDIDVSFNLNLKSVINVSQLVARGWSSGGAIVNVSSQASQRALAGHTVYCATKAALDAVTRSMALELGPRGIRVNCVNPTAVLTEMGRSIWAEGSRNHDWLTKRLPLGRLGEVEEVVHAILWLLSEGSSLTTGAAVPWMRDFGPANLIASIITQILV